MIISPIQIRFNDIDVFGHVNNSMHNQYFDIGKTQYMSEVLSDADIWKNKTLLLVHIELDFFSPILVNDEVVVQTSIYHVGNKSVKMLQRIVDKQGNVKSESRSILSSFDKSTQKSFEIPAEWRETINRFEQLL